MPSILQPVESASRSRLAVACDAVRESNRRAATEVTQESISPLAAATSAVESVSLWEHVLNGGKT